MDYNSKLIYTMEIIKGDIVVRYMQEEKKETLWQTKEPIIVKDSENKEVYIPVNFVTDFASVPKFLWSTVAPIGHYNLAAVIHDYYYTYKTVTRQFADQQFYEWMCFVSKKTKIRNWLMFIAVRLFGAKRYKENFLK